MKFSLNKYCIIYSILFFSCNRHLDNNDNNNPQGYADSQMVGTWKITGYSSSQPYDWNNDGRVESNIYNTWTACQKDNLYQFSADKTGLLKLDCSNTVQASWQIVNTLYLVYIPAGQSPDTEKIISMTSAEFKTSRDLTVSTGQNITVTKIWTRQ
ncbi:MAG TPA: hypothetical protein VI548_09170 [Chitinophagaceae bacterium]|nr:hypothetical protein [Chitinophagaceae bacterium]